MTIISDEARFIKSSHGRPILVDKEGYSYIHAKNSKTSSSKVFWTCRRIKKFNCKARATTDGFYIVKYQNVHSHSPPEDVFEIKEN